MLARSSARALHDRLDEGFKEEIWHNHKLTPSLLFLIDSLLAVERRVVTQYKITLTREVFEA